MTFTVPPSRRESITRQLRDEIVSGLLRPGTVIKDSEVAHRLGVSITPVREAIAQLTAEGLIDLAPNRVRRVTKVTRQNALDLIDVMEVLACAGVEWGVRRLTTDDLARMRISLDESTAALRSDDIRTATAAGADVSTIMITASGNTEIQPLVDLIVARTSRLLALSANDELWELWQRGYREVIQLLEEDDPDAAVARYRRIYVEFRAHVSRTGLD